VLRHEFQPGRLVAGLFLTAAGVTYAGDAGGWWDTPWFAVIPIVTVGLCLAGVAGIVAHAIHRRRRGTRGTGAPGASREGRRPSDTLSG
jgi:hypothetical protein